jgi:hypothetical protein
MAKSTRLKKSVFFGSACLGILAPLLALAALEPLPAGPELPPAGRSDFDLLIARNNGEIPYPFDKLAALLRDNTSGEQAAPFIPHGRSIQRAETDFTSPRILLGHSQNLIGSPISNFKPSKLEDLVNRLPPSRTYVGYTAKANSLEIFSWNETLGRYEVQLVKDYGPGLKPRLEYTSRELCFSCHQNGGPIFPEFNWGETDRTQWIAKKLEGMDTHGLRQNNVFGRLGDHHADTMDRAVRSSQSLLDFQKMWQEGCGPDSAQGRECRKLALRAILANPDGRQDPNRAELQRLDEIWKSTWPSTGIRLGTSEIQNRELENESSHLAPLSPGEDPLSQRSPRFLHYAEDAMNDYLENGVPADSSQLSMITDHLSFPNALSTEEIELLTKEAGGKDALLKLLDKPEFQDFFGPGPFRRRDFLFQVAKSLGKMDKNPWTGLESKLPPMVLGLAPGAKPGTQPAAKGLEHFKKFCAECHQGTANDEFHFMNAANDEELAQKIRSNPKILARLSWDKLPEEQRMPPTLERTRLEKENGTFPREEMLQFLKAGDGGKTCLEEFKRLAPVGGT